MWDVGGQGIVLRGSSGGVGGRVDGRSRGEGGCGCVGERGCLGGGGGVGCWCCGGIWRVSWWGWWGRGVGVKIVVGVCHDCGRDGDDVEVKAEETCNIEEADAALKALRWSMETVRWVGGAGAADGVQEEADDGGRSAPDDEVGIG